MKNYSMFDIIGPRMVGPSSSHTAGAARLGKIARRISGDQVEKVTFILYGSFAKTYQGHGTDRALVAGILGMDPDDERLSGSMEIARGEGLHFQFIPSEEDADHPNTVKILMTDKAGNTSEVVGASIGGGNIRISRINGLSVEFTGEYPTVLIRHIDRPGVIAEVTKIMASFQINIAFMRVFRHNRGEDAFMIIEVDESIPKEMIEQVKGLGNPIVQVYRIEGM